MHLNDIKRLILTADDQNLQYIDKYETENLHTMSDYPSTMLKKIQILQYMKKYLEENLVSQLFKLLMTKFIFVRADWRE